jgi:hypothetical protein
MSEKPQQSLEKIRGMYQDVFRGILASHYSVRINQAEARNSSVVFSLAQNVEAVKIQGSLRRLLDRIYRDIPYKIAAISLTEDRAALGITDPDEKTKGDYLFRPDASKGVGTLVGFNFNDCTVFFDSVDPKVVPVLHNDGTITSSNKTETYTFDPDVINDFTAIIPHMNRSMQATVTIQRGFQQKKTADFEDHVPFE